MKYKYDRVFFESDNLAEWGVNCLNNYGALDLRFVQFN